MSTLYIAEYQHAVIAYGNIPVAAGQEPSVTDQAVAIGGTSAQSAAFNARTRFVRIHTDVICSVLFGPNPTAVTTIKRMAAGQTEFWGVAPGDKVAVISNT